MTTIDLMAKVLEYEHALEHVAECHLGGCPDCVTVARSALDRDNRADFTELASEIAELAELERLQAKYAGPTS